MIDAVRVDGGGRLKLGHWGVLSVTVSGGDASEPIDVVAVTTDSAGLGVVTPTLGGRPVSAGPGRTAVAKVPIRPGLEYRPHEVRLLVDGRVVARRLVTVGPTGPAEPGSRFAINDPLPRQDRLFLQAGADVGVARAAREANLPDADTAAHATLVTDAGDLPTHPLGYDAVEAVVLLAEPRGWLAAMASDDSRIEALVDWVRSGGRLVLSVGSSGAELLGSGGPLAAFCPGDFDSITSLTVGRPLEVFAEAGPDVGPIELVGGVLPAVDLRDVRGVVEAYAGRSADETPLVVRCPTGFGEVTFVGVDLDAPSLKAWPGRPALIRKLLRLPLASGEPATSSNSPERPSVAQALVRRLDRSFSGVATPPFLLIVGLVVGYLALIGPGDYYLVHKVLRRPELTWVTFPAMVAVTCGAAYAAANWLKGDSVRVNQVELIDVDTADGRVRGALMTHFFSPRADRYSLRLKPRALDGADLPTDLQWTSSFGQDRSSGGGLLAGDRVTADYRLDPTANDRAPEVDGLPVRVWSTGTLLSRYGGQAPRSLDASLDATGDGLVEGLITNETGTTLEDCRLLYGVWAWRLGALRDGQSTAIGATATPIKRSTLLRTVSGKSGVAPVYYADLARRLSIPQLADLLAVGRATADPEADLPRTGLGLHLDAGRAVLLATVPGGPRSELLTGDDPLATKSVDVDAADKIDSANDPTRQSWVFARFLLDVDE